MKIGPTEEEVSKLLPNSEGMLIAIDRTELQRLAHHDCNLNWVKNLVYHLYNQGTDALALMASGTEWGVLVLDGLGFVSSLEISHIGLVAPEHSEKVILDHLAQIKKPGSLCCKRSTHYALDTLLKTNIFYSIPFPTHKSEGGDKWN